ncbi:glycoside hydrolase family 73 protein [Clostridium tetani]|uniref:glycoside hydrolase family 73 protein n=1 Tax=Clostridium tetani TaxID=1513 RepID=UPI000513A05A|nr:glucosaminidase domain-containing protein [Clostridium tetani]KGI44379.1 mannosyl-glycoprotein endo-beta-N-acetylglucosamidase [Clostridium tetani]RXI52894.1 mannosyl-glycoprotein endo-beta-N-acetylglucosamidase [Clostridium tetani]RXI55810.1 mannosyl-glycoprotein endo-beta-N-acetylglucosamidase [Clostridium tetani]RXM59034.1 mannosyl-glycoprotein endo-beta-N-acetylglucosamidase [Clostridium tetani]RXM71944.1 mannosyl-glycoprotein endo-beta-N-acetylglucosamidase [Clostridium tetani]
MRKIYKLFKLTILLFILLASFTFFKSINNKEFISNSSSKVYINSSDKISKDIGLQINWKEVAALHGVYLKNNFSNASEEEVLNLAKKFVDKNTHSTKFKGSIYKLVPLEEVMNNLSFKEKEKKKVYKNLDLLKDKYIVKVSEEKETFISALTPEAKSIYKEYDILPSIVIGQAILESDWGKSKLSSNYNNLFGIKATTSWKGKTVKMETSENYDDTIIDVFRSYDSKGNSLKDYAKFLKDNRRYKENGVFNSKTYIEQADSITKAGYSTKKDKDGNHMYGNLLTEIIREYNLQLIDNEVQNEYFKQIYSQQENF